MCFFCQNREFKEDQMKLKLNFSFISILKINNKQGDSYFLLSKIGFKKKKKKESETLIPSGHTNPKAKACFQKVSPRLPNSFTVTRFDF